MSTTDSNIRRMEKLTRKRIGERIRSARLERTFSLNQLARKSGLSCSTIHKIEQHRMVPTVTTLLKIARGLDKEVNFFIEDEDSLRGFKIIRKEGSTISAIKPQCALIRAVSSRFHTTKLEVHHTVIGKGGKNGREYLFHHSEEVAICLKGKMEFLIEKEKVCLYPMDSIHIRGGTHHRWENVANGKSEVVFIFSPPLFSWSGR